jgi:hypothetical protein
MVGLYGQDLITRIFQFKVFFRFFFRISQGIQEMSFKAACLQIHAYSNENFENVFEFVIL